MQVHLVDGTFELFRAWFGAPAAQDAGGREVGAVRSLARTLLALVGREGATHVGVAFDSTVDSFRNRLYEGYKTGEGLEPELLAQFELAERATAALGMVVWPMVELEADDALATAAARYADESAVERVVIASPDKDLTQCVRGTRVVCLDRMRKRETDEDGVWERFGVAPASIPDWLALVGDAADGIPGVARWGKRSASLLLAAYGHVEDVPDDHERWNERLSTPVRGARALAEILAAHRDELRLYKELATLREDAPVEESLADLAWRGARRDALGALADELDDPRLPERVPRWHD